MAQLNNIALGSVALLTACALHAPPVAAMELTRRIGLDAWMSIAPTPARSTEQVHAHEATTVLPLLSDNEAFAVRLLLTKGHLRVGAEAYASGSVTNALAHMGEPVNVLHRDIVKWIGHPTDESTDTPLNRLVAATRNGMPPEVVSQRLSIALRELDGTMDILDAKFRESPAFVVTVALAVVQAATDEFETGVSEGQIVDIIEYQDARGFVLEARAFIEKASVNLTASNRGAYGILTAELEALEMDLPFVVQPGPTQTSAADLRRAVVRIGLLYDSFN